MGLKWVRLGAEMGAYGMRWVGSGAETGLDEGKAMLTGLDEGMTQGTISLISNTIDAISDDATQVSRAAQKHLDDHHSGSIKGHGYPVIAVAWNHGENLLASSDFGDTVIVWKREKTKQKRNSLICSKKPKSMTTGSWERSMYCSFSIHIIISEEFGLKPMNCPGHCVIFDSRPRSYRELPLRIADFGVLHRNEASGALTGLTRVRTMLIFSAENLRGQENILGDLETWDKAEMALADALNEFGKPWHLCFDWTSKFPCFCAPQWILKCCILLHRKDDHQWIYLKGKFKSIILKETDVASKGLDFPDIHVINYDMSVEIGSCFLFHRGKAISLYPKSHIFYRIHAYKEDSIPARNVTLGEGHDGNTLRSTR
ncbi:Threonyl-tRNA synthetase [Artemisia annua]|uniref:Threonyl-tRNA synthetase n=1 Tax=Artemisia annua TaxID=35608 RepID=A0A2U1NHB3_ARTAN|nr:Threonyl-tRNA synthetase [Artemisia annua]